MRHDQDFFRFASHLRHFDSRSRGTAGAGDQLARRISLAVDVVCGPASDFDLAGKNEVRRCRVETRAKVASDRDQRIASASSQPIEIAAR
jgi:hypothetical protein